MEYCSRPNLATRYRAERLSVAEVLRIGVRIAGAVETAHRAGILHRDIKPANVLTTDFGHPVLSDFGISVSRTSPQAAAGTVGMSIPWTAPEMFTDGAPGDERSDVYSLAATLYTVLARRSPFDRPGAPNRSADLIGRIRTAPVPTLGRSDVPPSLERLLVRAMDKNPAARPGSALEFARGLQRVETEMRLAPTPVDVLAERPEDVPAQPDDGVATRIRSLTVIDPAPDPSGAARHGSTDHSVFAPGPAPSTPSTPSTPYGGFSPAVASSGLPSGSADAPTAASPDAPDRSSAGWAATASVWPGGQDSGGASTGTPDPAGTGYRDPRGELDTIRRDDATAAIAGPPANARSRVPLLIGGGALVAVAALVTTLVLVRGSGSPAPPDHTGDTLATLTSPNDPIGGAVPQPADLTGKGTGTGVLFDWRNPDPEDGDSFQWYRTDTGTIVRHITSETSVTVPGTGRLCIAVVLVRSDGTSSPQPATKCASSRRGTS
jgi:hypothetical protein